VPLYCRLSGRNGIDNGISFEGRLRIGNKPLLDNYLGFSAAMPHMGTSAFKEGTIL
jgi:hypothetical protein